MQKYELCLKVPNIFATFLREIVIFFRFGVLSVCFVRCMKQKLIIKTDLVRDTHYK